jgi:hypothetical protein
MCGAPDIRAAQMSITLTPPHVGRGNENHGERIGRGCIRCAECVLVTSFAKKLPDRREAPYLFFHWVQGSPLPRKFETTVVSNFNKVISPSRLLLVEANSGI